MPTSLLPPFFLVKWRTPPTASAAMTAMAMMRRINLRRFFLSAGLFSGFFAGACAAASAGAAVSAGVCTFFSSMISAISTLLFMFCGPDTARPSKAFRFCFILMDRYRQINNKTVTISLSNL